MDGKTIKSVKGCQHLFGAGCNELTTPACDNLFVLIPSKIVIIDKIWIKK
jgi:hypothetical protein